jgi:hypothetical protein
MRWYDVRIWGICLIVAATFAIANSTHEEPPLITDSYGEFVCSSAKSPSGILYTASHCIVENQKLYVNGKETPYADMPGDIVQIGNKSFQKDNGIMYAKDVKKGMKVKALLGGMSFMNNEPQYFEIAGEILDVYTSKEMNYLLDDNEQDASHYALASFESFPGCSGSGVFYKGKLIGVVVAGVKGYTIIALINEPKPQNN